MRSFDHDVVIAGGGPAGLMLAGELALAGTDVAVVERRPSQELPGSRAGGLHPRAIEILDQRGIAERFLAEGQKAQVGQFAGVAFDIADFPTRHPYSLGLWQNHIERILAGWVEELPVTFLRGREVTGLEQDEHGVEVAVSDGSTVRARYLVGCDGGRSTVRRAAGIEFPGVEPTTSTLIAEVELADEVEWGTRHDDIGVHGLGRVDYEVRDGEIVWADSGPVRAMVTERHLQRGAEPTLDELRAALIDVYGTDYGVHSPTWISRFTDAVRQASTYRAGRVLLAGDSAHVHSPDGAQGLQLGLADAANLGWKLARVVGGGLAEELLDTYDAERRPAGARVLRTTMAHVALRRTDERSKALRDTVAELFEDEQPRRRMAATLFGLDVHYDLGDGHPLLGRRMPDVDLVTPEGATRVYELMHGGRPLLIDFAGSTLDVTGWADRVRVATAEPVQRCELPVIGTVPAPSAVLVRPDGYVAWVGEGSDDGLAEALSRWFGPPAGG